jgi:hypothetical protein
MKYRDTPSYTIEAMILMRPDHAIHNGHAKLKRNDADYYARHPAMLETTSAF